VLAQLGEQGLACLIQVGRHRRAIVWRRAAGVALS
jgi:hypothetical protein